MQTDFSAEQLADPEVAASEKILRKCVHCGFCTATCPTYVLLGDELDSPRGRIYLIKDMLERDRPATAEVVRHLDRCLSCLGCMTTCPSGVHYQHLIDHARAHVERTFRRPLSDRLIRRVIAAVLPYPGRFRVALGLAAVARPFARLLPRKLRPMLDLVPRGHRAPAAEGEASNPARPATMRVALLTGCVQPALAPWINAATARLLRRAGVEPVELSGCCGAIEHHLGRTPAARTTAAAHVDRLSAELGSGAIDAVVVNASGCGTHMKDFGFVLRDDAARAERAELVADRTRDITEVLAEVGMPPATIEPGLSVAYHSACSMQHGQRLDEIPRRLLADAGFDVAEIPEGHLCCGSAGTYNILQPEIAGELRRRKLGNIDTTGAAVVATGNLGCITQLGIDSGRPVVHTVELLDWATGGPKPAAIAASWPRPIG